MSEITQDEKLHSLVDRSRFNRLLSIIWQLFVSVWFIGTIWNIGRLAFNYWDLRRILSNECLEISPQVQKEYESAVHCVPLNPVPRLLLTDDISGPFSVGYCNPCDILPPWIAHCVSMAQLQEIFVHELAHTLRRDQVTVWFQNLTGAPGQFSPNL
ncbi:MAG: hypothetical protein KDB03_13675 [Planctomycetales bacterium]|nr:hypothetical protein [Planctomycetales bacterium]